MHYRTLVYINLPNSRYFTSISYIYWEFLHYLEILLPLSWITCNIVCIPQIERARWLWDKQSKEEAMTLLGSYLSEIEKSPDSITSRGRAEAKLLYANWRELTSYYDSEDIQHLFLKVLIPCLITLKSLRWSLGNVNGCDEGQQLQYLFLRPVFIDIQ